jgi:hypothetical protein
MEQLLDGGIWFVVGLVSLIGLTVGTEEDDAVLVFLGALGISLTILRILVAFGLKVCFA